MTGKLHAETRGGAGIRHCKSGRSRIPQGRQHRAGPGGAANTYWFLPAGGALLGIPTTGCARTDSRKDSTGLGTRRRLSHHLPTARCPQHLPHAPATRTPCAHARPLSRAARWAQHAPPAMPHTPPSLPCLLHWLNPCLDPSFSSDRQSFRQVLYSGRLHGPRWRALGLQTAAGRDWTHAAKQRARLHARTQGLRTPAPHA